MRSFHRLAIVLTAIVIFSITHLAVARAQSPDMEATFAKARELEAQPGKENEALAEYDRLYNENRLNSLSTANEALFRKAAYQAKLNRQADVVRTYRLIVSENQARNPETAAEALYRLGFYLKDHYGTNDAEKHHARHEAWVAWNISLLNDFPRTEAARKVVAGGEQSPLAQLRDQLDSRGKSDWKYRVIDALVALTGRHPAFSYGFALVLLAVLVKILLYPLTKRQYAAMREMQRMQPLVKELQQKYKGQELHQKTMELWKQHKVNPFASCLPTMLQIPFLILVYTAVNEYQYAFSRGHFLWIGSSLAEQNPHIFGRNLSVPDLPLLVLYMIANYVTMRMTPQTDPQQQQTQNTMALVTSVIFFWMFLSYKWPVAFVLYWFVLNLISIGQQYVYVYKPHKDGTLTAPALGGVSNGLGSAVSPSMDGKGNGKANAPVNVPAQPTRVRPRRKKR